LLLTLACYYALCGSYWLIECEASALSSGRRLNWNLEVSVIRVARRSCHDPSVVYRIMIRAITGERSDPGRAVQYHSHRVSVTPAAAVTSASSLLSYASQPYSLALT